MAFMKKKLVRDKIPGIMRKEGRRFILRRVEKDELFKYLLEKKLSNTITRYFIVIYICSFSCDTIELC